MGIRRFKTLLFMLLLATVASSPLNAATANAQFIVRGLPDLSVFMAAAPNPVSTAGTLTYTLQVANSTTEVCKPAYPEPICHDVGQPVSNVAVALTLPVGAQYKFGSGDHGFTCPASITGRTVTCTGGSLATTDLAVLSVNATAPGSPGSITAVATVDPNNAIAEQTKANNTAQVATNVTQAGPRAYVAHTALGTVSVIDMTTNSVVNYFPLAACDIAEGFGGSRLYAADCKGNLMVLDTASDSAVSSTPVGNIAHAVAVSPDGAHIYVSGGLQSGGVRLAVLDATTNSVVKDILITSAQAGSGFLSVSPDGARVYVSWSDVNNGHISIVDTATYQVVQTLVAGTGASWVSEGLTLDGRALYYSNGFEFSVLDTGANKVSHVNSPFMGGLVVNPAGTRVYSEAINTIGVVDTRTNSLVAQVPIDSGGQIAGLTISADGTRLWVIDSILGRVDQIDTATNMIVARVPIQVYGYKVALPPARPRVQAYVASSGTNSISVVDRATNKSIATIPVGSQPDGVAVAAGGNRALATNSGSNNVSVIDTKTNAVTGTIGVGQRPVGVAYNPSGTRAYVANFWSGTVSVIDTSANSVIATVPTGTDPNHVAVSPDARWVYVTNYGGGSLTVIDASTNTNIGTINVGGQPAGLAFTPDGARLYAASSVGSTGGVSVIDPVTRTVVASIPVPFSSGVTITPDGARVYVTEPNISRVAVIDTATNTVTATLPIGWSPLAATVSPDGARLYVSDWGGGGEGNTVHVVDTVNNAELGTFTVGATPLDMTLGFVP